MSGFSQFQLPSNVTSFEKMMSYNNYLTGNWYGVSIGLTVFFIVFLVLNYWKTEHKFVAASFAMLLVNLALYALQIIGGIAMTLTIVVFISAALVMFYDSGR